MRKHHLRIEIRELGEPVSVVMGFASIPMGVLAGTGRSILENVYMYA
jgi:hypothetical protein